MKRVGIWILVLLVLCGCAGAEVDEDYWNKEKWIEILSYSCDKNEDDVRQMIDAFEAMVIERGWSGEADINAASIHFTIMSFELAAYLGEDDFSMALRLTEFLFFDGDSFSKYGVVLSKDELDGLSYLYEFNKDYNKLSDVQKIVLRYRFLEDATPDARNAALRKDDNPIAGGTLGGNRIDIVSFKQTKSLSLGTETTLDCITILFDWSHSNKEKSSFIMNFTARAYQDGVELKEWSFISNSSELENFVRVVGYQTVRTQSSYILLNKTSPVKVVVTEASDNPNGKVEATLSLEDVY